MVTNVTRPPRSSRAQVEPRLVISKKLSTLARTPVGFGACASDVVVFVAVMVCSRADRQENGQAAWAVALLARTHDDQVNSLRLRRGARMRPRPRGARRPGQTQCGRVRR